MSSHLFYLMLGVIVVSLFITARLVAEIFNLQRQLDRTRDLLRERAGLPPLAPRPADRWEQRR